MSFSIAGAAEMPTRRIPLLSLLIHISLVVLVASALQQARAEGPAEPEGIDEHSLAREWQDLNRTEEALIAEHHALHQQKLTADELIDWANTEIAKAPESERAQLSGTRDRFGLITLQDAPQLTAVRSLLIETAQRYEKFQEQYDKYNLDKLEYMMRRFLYVSNNVLQEGKETGELSEKQRGQLQAMRTNMINAYHEYRANRKWHRSSQDLRRRMAFVNFLGEQQKFINAVAAPHQSFSRKLATNVQRMKEAAVKYNTLAETLKALPTLIYKSWRRQPVRDTVIKMAHRMEKKEGVTMRLINEHGVPELKDDKEINVFVIPHTNSVFDLSAGAVLPVDKLLVLTNPTAMEYLRPMLERYPDATVAGEGRNPVAEMVPKLTSDAGYRSIAAFPEASLGALVGYDTRPFRDSFTRMNIGLLRAAGLNPNLVPVATPNSTQLMEWYGAGASPLDTRELTTEIGRSIAGPLMNVLYANDKRGANAATAILRQSWLDHTEKRALGQDRFMGMPRMRTMVPEVDRLLILRSGCDYFWKFF